MIEIHIFDTIMYNQPSLHLPVKIFFLVFLLTQLMTSCQKGKTGNNTPDNNDPVTNNVQPLSQKMFGDTLYDWINAMAPSSDGGHLLVGFTNYDTAGSTHNGDAWMVKVNSKGDTVWTRTMGGPHFETANAVVAAPDGGFIVVCAADSSNSNYAGSNFGGTDWWIIKLKSNGDTDWTRLIGTTAFEYPIGVAVTPDGSFIVTGYKSSSAINGDVMVVKLSNTGNIIWQKTLGGQWRDWGGAVTVALDGSILIAAISQNSNSGDVVGTNHGEEDYWIIKLNPNGSIVWSKLLGGDKIDVASAIKSTPDGGCIVVGSTTSSENGSVTGKNHGDQDLWVVKLSNSGDITWNSLFGGSRTDVLGNNTNIVITPEGNFVIAGFSSSYDGDVGQIKGGFDFWLLKLDSNGKKIWSKTCGGISDDQANDLSMNTDGSFWVVGGTESNNNGNVGANKGRGDGWLIRVKDE